jgi:hypothetical protein
MASSRGAALRLLCVCLVPSWLALTAAASSAAELSAAELERIRTVRAALPPPQPPPDPKSISFTLFPAGENRDLTIRTCAVCHAPEIVAQKPRTIEQWDTIIARMVAYGAVAGEDQQLAILTYLATYLAAPEPAAAPATTSAANP